MEVKGYKAFNKGLTNRYGRKFLGCTNYPVCKNTKECEEAGIGMESIG